MALVDVIEAKDIEQLNQSAHSLLDHAEQILRALRDGTRVHLTIEFEEKDSKPERKP